jgi:hypothetical protein
MTAACADEAPGRFFFGGAPGAGTPGGIGMNIVKNEHWRFGVGFGTETRKPRYVSDDPVLHERILHTARSAVGAEFCIPIFWRGAFSYHVRLHVHRFGSYRLRSAVRRFVQVPYSPSTGDRPLAPSPQLLWECYRGIRSFTDGTMNSVCVNAPKRGRVADRILCIALAIHMGVSAAGADKESRAEDITPN